MICLPYLEPHTGLPAPLRVPRVEEVVSSTNAQKLGSCTILLFLFQSLDAGPLGCRSSEPASHLNPFEYRWQMFGRHT